MKTMRRLFERLDGRDYLSGFGIIVQDPLPNVSVQAGTQDVPVARERVVILGGSVTDINFSPKRGSSLAAVEDYDLRADLVPQGRPDGIFETVLARDIVPAQNGDVHFSVNPRLFRGNLLTGLMVTADMKANAPNARMQLSKPVAVMTGGTMFVNGVENPVITVTARREGIVTVTGSTTPVTSHDVLGGTLSDDLLRMRVRSEFEGADVFYIGIDVAGQAASIDRIELFVPGQNTPFAVASVAGAEVGDTFGARMTNRDLIVAEGDAIDIIARARVRSDVDGGVSGHQFALAVDAVMARGITSSNAITPTFTGGPVTGPTHRVVMSKVSNISNASPDADGSAIPTGFNRAIGQLKFSGAATANLHNGMNRVVLSTVELEVDATNVALAANGFALYNKADPLSTSNVYRLERLDGTAIPITGTVTGVFRVVFTSLEQSGVDTAIDPGSDSTFVLGANVINTKVDSSLASNLQTSLRPSRVRWLDRDNGGALAFTGVEFPESIVRSTIYRG